MSERILVTGGAGYVGGGVVEALLAAGHQVAVFDNFSTGHRAALPRDIMIVEGDLANRHLIEQALRDFRADAVVHTAGSIEAGESMKDPGKYYRNNVVNSINLLDAMVATVVGRFIFSSSAGVYGNPVRVPIEEDDPTAPVNCYGETKLAVERAATWYAQTHNLRTIFLRYFNAAGATERLGEAHQPESHLIPRVLQVALGQSEHFSIYGADYPTPDGTAIRDYIHIADLAQAHVLAVEAAKTRSGAFNLGSGSGFSVRQIVETARQVTGHPIPTVDVPRRPGDPAILIANSQRARAVLGWRPRYDDVAAIIKSAWEWHQKHPTGYSG
ncbi:MAG TPA: UDP-glucose 4-epimerase GalE [Chloroflexota bacterium]|nr:UDP-glucose 4-epimerase GalE [Chloroflexota bacterium]